MEERGLRQPCCAVGAALSTCRQGPPPPLAAPAPHPAPPPAGRSEIGQARWGLPIPRRRDAEPLWAPSQLHPCPGWPLALSAQPVPSPDATSLPQAGSHRWGSETAVVNAPSTPGSPLSYNKPSGAIQPLGSTQPFHESPKTETPLPCLGSSPGSGCRGGGQGGFRSVPGRAGLFLVPMAEITLG